LSSKILNDFKVGNSKSLPNQMEEEKRPYNRMSEEISFYYYYHQNKM